MSFLSLGKKFCPKPLLPVFERIEQSPIARKLAGGGFWLLSGTVVGKGIAFLISIVLVRVLGREGFGEYVMLMSTSLLFLALADFGMGTTMSKYVPELLVKDKDRAGRIIGLSYVFPMTIGVSISFFFFMAAPWFCGNILHAPQLSSLMRFSGLLLILMAFALIQAGLLRGFQDFYHVAVSDVIGGFLKFCLVVLGACLDGLRGAMIGWGAALLLICFINGFFIRRNARKFQVRCTFRNLKSELPVLYRFSFPLLYYSLVLTVVFWISDAVLASYEGFSELALYTSARQIFLIIRLFGVLSGQVFLPLLSETRAKGDAAKCGKIIKIHFVTNMTVTILLALPVLAGAPYVMQLLYGPGFQDGGYGLMLFCLTAIVLSVEDVAMVYLITRDRAGIFLVQTSLWAVVHLGLAWVMIANYHLGAFGIALTYLIAVIVRVSFTAIYACHVARQEKNAAGLRLDRSS